MHDPVESIDPAEFLVTARSIEVGGLETVCTDVCTHTFTFASDRLGFVHQFITQT